MCRFKQGGIRLDKGTTRETQGPCDDKLGIKRSSTLCSQQIKSRRRTKERRHQRAFKKMSESAQERILKQRQERKTPIYVLFFQMHLEKNPI